MKKLLTKIPQMKAIYLNRSVRVKPVFFPEELAFKNITSGSVFCQPKSDFKFSFEAKVRLFFIEIAYWFYAVLWRKIRYQWPYKFEQLICRFRFVKNTAFSFNDDLPF